MCGSKIMGVGSVPEIRIWGVMQYEWHLKMGAWMRSLGESVEKSRG